jgi:putative FmdB family regulatory protein
VNRENASLPLYEYECEKCGRRHERIENFKGPHLKKCPACGGKVEQLISAPALQFKGTGWYVTDYAGKSVSGESAKNDAVAAEKAADTKSSSDAKDAKSAKDSKEGKDTKESKKPKSESKSESKKS